MIPLIPVLVLDTVILTVDAYWPLPGFRWIVFLLGAAMILLIVTRVKDR